MSGDTLTLLRVTPEEAGVYVCTATNQQSRLFSIRKKSFTQTRRPVSRKISVFVEHQPTVELEELLVQVRSRSVSDIDTIDNNQADGGVEVVCMVTGWPKPRLEWRTSQG